MTKYVYHSFPKIKKKFSPLLRNPPLWHTEELLAGQSNYRKYSIFLKKEQKFKLGT